MTEETIESRPVVVDGCAPLLSKPGAWEGWQVGGADLAVPTVATHEGPDETSDRLRHWTAWIDGVDRLTHVTAPADLDALGDGRMGIVFHFQNTTPLGEDLGLLDAYHRRGVRMIQLTYNHRNAVGGGCMDTRDDGLTAFGRDLIGEMDRLGVVIDLSHTGRRTTLEAIESSAHPVVFSHSNAKRLFDHPRNITDHQIRAVAEREGLVGVNAVSSFLRTGGTGARLSDVVDHIDYLVQMIGPDRVCLGLDFWSDAEIAFSEWTRAGMWTRDDLSRYVSWPDGLSGPGHIGRIAEELDARGYPSGDIAAIMGNNWVRLFRTVWI